MNEKKQFLIDYFKKLLDNDLNAYTLDWIDNNYQIHAIPQCYASTLWQLYTKHFEEKYNLGMWHNVMPYNELITHYTEVGFSEKAATKYATHVRRIMDEKDAWEHMPNIFYWATTTLNCKKRNGTYNIKDYY